MKRIGRKSEIEGVLVTNLTPIRDIVGLPRRFPYAPENIAVFCGYDLGTYEDIFLCSTLSDMEQHYLDFSSGMAFGITWYTGEIIDPGAYNLTPKAGLTRAIVQLIVPNAPSEVEVALIGYAADNAGAASVLARQAQNFTSAKQVEELVGWPLSEHNQNRAAEIWERFRHLG